MEGMCLADALVLSGPYTRDLPASYLSQLVLRQFAPKLTRNPNPNIVHGYV